jgi:hypothetical protein
MKKLLLSSILIGALLAGAVAQSPGAPSDVPRDHWAYSAVDTLFRLGLLSGYPAQVGRVEFRGNRAVTRFETPGSLLKVKHDFSKRLARIHASLESNHANDQPSRDIVTLQQSLVSLRNDIKVLQSWQLETQELRGRYAEIGENIRKLREEIRSMREQLRKGGTTR